MQQRLPPPVANPLSRLLAAVVAVLALVGAFFFGLVVLALAVGLGLLAWLALAGRLWWLRRKLGASRGGPRDPFGGPGRDTGGDPGRHPGRDDRPREGQVIDADYEVVSRREDD